MAEEGLEEEGGCAEDGCSGEHCGVFGERWKRDGKQLGDEGRFALVGAEVRALWERFRGGFVVVRFRTVERRIFGEDKDARL
jgi:hypothetical protein